MQVDLKNNHDEITMHIVAAWDEVEADYKELWKHYSRIPVKGFRAGAVPAKVIETMFKSEMQNELANRCAPRICRKALLEQKLENGTPITVNDVELIPNAQFTFTATFLRMPEFELPDYTHLQLTASSTEDRLTEISEKLLASTVMHLPNKLVEEELSFSEGDGATPDDVRKTAEDRIKLLLILKRIAQKDGIEVDDKDIEERIRRIAHENNSTPDNIRNYLLTNGSLSRLGDFLLAEQVLSYIAELNN